MCSHTIEPSLRSSQLELRNLSVIQLVVPAQQKAKRNNYNTVTCGSWIVQMALCQWSKWKTCHLLGSAITPDSSVVMFAESRSKILRRLIFRRDRLLHFTETQVIVEDLRRDGRTVLIEVPVH